MSNWSNIRSAHIYASHRTHGKKIGINRTYSMILKTCHISLNIGDSGRSVIPLKYGTIPFFKPHRPRHQLMYLHPIPVTVGHFSLSIPSYLTFYFFRASFPTIYFVRALVNLSIHHHNPDVWPWVICVPGIHLSGTAQQWIQIASFTNSWGENMYSKEMHNFPLVLFPST